MALEQLGCQHEDPNEYQLLLSGSKETQQDMPLIGHEIPFAIKMNHTRNICCQANDENDNQTAPADPNLTCQFILRKSRKGGCRSQLDINKTQKSWKIPIPIRKAPIINWAMNKKQAPYKNPYNQNDMLPPGKLFGNALCQLSTEEETIPKPIQDMMVTLFRKGPGTTGIFRKSANQRTAKQLRQALDTGKEVEIHEKSAIIVATVLKEFFRSLPESLVISEIFEEMCNTKNQPDPECRIDEIKRLLLLLPKENYEIMMEFMCVLYHVQRFSDRNNMNSYNLSLCVSPSVMKPPKDCPKSQIEQTACSSDVVTFIIDNYIKIFSSDNEYLLGPETDIQFDDGPGEDSDSGTDQYKDRDLSLDDGDDSEKEMEPQTPDNIPTDLLFQPNIECPFGHSDSSIGTNESDELKNSFNRMHPPSILVPEINRSKSTPSSPLSARRDEEMDSGVSYENMSDYDDHNECYKRSLLRQPRPKRLLTNTSNTSELIEHKRHIPEVHEYSREEGKKKDLTSKRSGGTFNVRTLDCDETHEAPTPPTTTVTTPNDESSPLFPKKQIISQPLVQHFATEFYAAPEYFAPAKPNVVFHNVDKRRKPAAPTYEEHLQKTQQAKPKTVQAATIRKPKVNKKAQVQRHSVEDYKPPQPLANCNASPTSPTKSTYKNKMNNLSSHLPHNINNFMQNRKNKAQHKSQSETSSTSHHRNQNGKRNVRNDNSPKQQHLNETSHQNHNSIAQLQNENFATQVRNNKLATQSRDDILTTHSSNKKNNTSNHSEKNNIPVEHEHVHDTCTARADQREKSPYSNLPRTVEEDSFLRVHDVEEVKVCQHANEVVVVAKPDIKTKKVPRISVTCVVKDTCCPAANKDTCPPVIIKEDTVPTIITASSTADNMNSILDSSCDELPKSSSPYQDASNIKAEIVLSSNCNKISREGRKVFRTSAKLHISPSASPSRAPKKQSLSAIVLSKSPPHHHTKKERSMSETSITHPNYLELHTTRRRSTSKDSIRESDEPTSLAKSLANSPTSSGPFSLNLTSNVNRTECANVAENPTKFQLKAGVITKARSKNDLLPINQLTKKPNESRDDTAKTVSAKELRRTSRKLKSEFRTFGDGKVVNTPRDERRVFDPKKKNMCEPGLAPKVFNTKLNNGHYNTGKDPLRRGVKLQNETSDTNKENVTRILLPSSPQTGHANTNSKDKLCKSNSSNTNALEQISVDSVKSNSGESSTHDAYSTMMSQEESYV